jgi:hypothetical protein
MRALRLDPVTAGTRILLLTARTAEHDVETGSRAAPTSTSSSRSAPRSSQAACARNWRAERKYARTPRTRRGAAYDHVHTDRRGGREPRRAQPRDGAALDPQRSLGGDDRGPRPGDRSRRSRERRSALIGAGKTPANQNKVPCSGGGSAAFETRFTRERSQVRNPPRPCRIRAQPRSSDPAQADVTRAGSGVRPSAAQVPLAARLGQTRLLLPMPRGRKPRAPASPCR